MAESEQFPGSHLPHSAICKATISSVCHLSVMWSTGEPEELGPSKHPIHFCWPATPYHEGQHHVAHTHHCAVSW
jgi:hypothetical protein